MAAHGNRNWKRGAAGIAALLLAACQKQPTVLPPPVMVAQPPPPAAAPAAPPREAATIDEYKEQIARRIMAANPQLIFSGRLPEMMEAIVVLDIGITRDGELASVRVHRAPGPHSAEIAQQAVKAAAPYPKPGKLLSWTHHSLVFSETFLFNRDYRFQLRTLAGPQ
jgi:protein TonB